MREIKFRAWDKGAKLMIYDVQDAYDGLSSDNNSFELNEEYSYVCCFSEFIDSENFILMQCTGLKDENGVEIYEGDIVCDRYANKYTPIFRNGIYMAYNVEYLYLTKQEPSTQFNVVWRDGCEVIGNIYENPELLDKH